MVMISMDPCVLSIHVCSQFLGFLFFCLFCFCLFFLPLCSVMKAVFSAVEEKNSCDIINC